MERTEEESRDLSRHLTNLDNDFHETMMEFNLIEDKYEKIGFGYWRITKQEVRDTLLNSVIKGCVSSEQDKYLLAVLKKAPLTEVRKFKIKMVEYHQQRASRTNP